MPDLAPFDHSRAAAFEERLVGVLNAGALCPIGSLVYTISCMHCMTVSLAEGGDGLGAMWGKEMAVQYLQEAGVSLRRSA